MITFKSENLHGAQLNGHGTMYGGLWLDTRYASWVRFEDFEITNFNILGINSKDTDDTSPFARASRIEFYRLKIPSHHAIGQIRIIARFIAAGQVTIVQQLVKAGPAPVFGAVKNSKPRPIMLMAKTAKTFHHR